MEVRSPGHTSPHLPLQWRYSSGAPDRGLTSRRSWQAFIRRTLTMLVKRQCFRQQWADRLLSWLPLEPALVWYHVVCAKAMSPEPFKPQEFWDLLTDMEPEMLRWLIYKSELERLQVPGGKVTVGLAGRDRIDQAPLTLRNLAAAEARTEAELPGVPADYLTVDHRTRKAAAKAAAEAAAAEAKAAEAKAADEAATAEASGAEGQGGEQKQQEEAQAKQDPKPKPKAEPKPKPKAEPKPKPKAEPKPKAKPKMLFSREHAPDMPASGEEDLVLSPTGVLLVSAQPPSASPALLLDFCARPCADATLAATPPRRQSRQNGLQHAEDGPVHQVRCSRGVAVLRVGDGQVESRRLQRVPDRDPVRGPSGLCVVHR
jgi:hypothetical protein